MFVWLLLACGSSALEEGFDRTITRGWACGDSFYIGLNTGQRFRVQIELDPAEAERPGRGTFLVYTGRRLIVDDGDNRCDDVSTSGLFGAQDLDYVYEAIEGRATVVDDGDRRSYDLEGIVLRANNAAHLGDWDLGRPDWEDLPDVAMADGTLEFVRRDDL